MKKVDIVQKGHEALHRVSEIVPVEEIGAARIQNIISRMRAALYATEDGVAIAAPQIGENVRIFLIHEKAFEDPTDEELVYINPIIIKHAKKKKELDEGCLSVRGYYGKTKRYTQATVRAYNEYGELFERGGGGLLAQIFQHEIDHLDGILFVDHATGVEKIESI
ncbi:peptide deformylase [Candidatus Nomurabacteria bacterium]|nr:peptide deformylase [Candidatus Nomurabacteria bacterium]